MLLLKKRQRTKLWQHMIAAIETYLAQVRNLPVFSLPEPAEVRALLAGHDFAEPIGVQAALKLAVKGLTRYQIHTSHPRYFGLFDPAPTTMSIAADALVAAFNPQVVAWMSSPFAVEVERHLVHALGSRFGYALPNLDGTFTSGGAEANHTALLSALVQAFPDVMERGLGALGTQPVLYLSEEGHPTILKAAQLCGLGRAAVHQVPVDTALRMVPEALAAAIAQDRAAGLTPFLVVATAGTTSAGVIDPLPEIATLTEREGLWLHVDAAWGGAFALVPELRPLLDGIERADSLTFDPHKGLAVPLGAGLYLTRHQGVLERTFRVESVYEEIQLRDEVVDPFTHSMAWSRRFMGLKVFLSLLVAGWETYATALRRQVALGDLLRQLLQAADWQIVNTTPLPVVCFLDGTDPQGGSAERVESLVQRVNASGKAGLFTMRLQQQVVIRACITNYRTTPRDVEALVKTLNRTRNQMRKPAQKGAKAKGK